MNEDLKMMSLKKPYQPRFVLVFDDRTKYQVKSMHLVLQKFSFTGILLMAKLAAMWHGGDAADCMRK